MVIANLKYPEYKSRRPYRGEWIGRFHGDAMPLNLKTGKLKALADIDHVI